MPMPRGTEILGSTNCPSANDVMASSNAPVLLIHKKERRRLGKNHAPRDVENRAEELIVVGDRVDQTADLDQTFVDI